MSHEDRKERVLHTRVPERLEQELKERAAELGMSVSNLVRNVLTHAFDLVGDIVADGAQVARSASRVGRRERAPMSPVGISEIAVDDDDVIGWQPMVLQKNAVCTSCNDILPRGKDAAIAITSSNAGSRPIVCTQCLEELRHESASRNQADH